MVVPAETFPSNISNLEQQQVQDVIVNVTVSPVYISSSTETRPEDDPQKRNWKKQQQNNF